VEIHHRLDGEQQALDLLRVNLQPFEEFVEAQLSPERPANDNVFSAHVALCFNIGKASYETCSALREFNAGRLEDSAASFGLWTGATCDRPPKWLRDKPELFEAYKNKMAQDHKGGWRWVGPTGQYCRYMLRYEGLLKRHYSEALLEMGKDWNRALHQNGAKVRLVSVSPDEAKWNAKKNRWEDQVNWDATTPFKDVLAFAYDDKLSEIEPDELILFDKVEAAAPIATETKGGEAVEGPSPAAVSPATPLETQSAPTVELSGPGAGKAGEPEKAAPTASTAPPLTPSSAPASSPVGAGKAGEQTVAPRPAPPPPVLKPTIPPEKPKAPPVHIDTSSLRTENMRVDAKPMEFSDRAMWFAVKLVGFWLKVMAGRGAIPVTAVSYYFDFFNDPFMSSVVITGGTWLTGECVRRFAEWKLKFHRNTASTALV
jgi:hypothetical protein